MTTPSEILDRLPPQDLEAEKAVLGSIMLDARYLDDVAAVLRPEDFYSDANARLYRHLLDMHDAGRRIDAVLLGNALKKSGSLEAVGGVAYIAEVTEAVAVASHAKYYAGLVVKASRSRALIHAAAETLRDAYDPTADFEATLNRAEAALAAIPTGNHEGEPVTAQQAAMEAIEAIEATQKREQRRGVLTGLPSVDHDLGGLFAGELIILAARTSVGKTALATQWAYHAASHGRPVYFASLEMSRVELVNRIACGISGVSPHRLRTCRMSDDETARLAEAMNEVSRSALTIHDRPGLSVADIRRAARRMVRQGLALIVVDYLQLLTPPDRRIQRYEQVGQMTAGLKAVARELSVPALVLCQLNRQAEQQGRPTLSNLRESGAIEQDADMVMFITRPDDGFTDGGLRWDAELAIAKNRHGETGAFRLNWEPEATRFVPVGGTEWVP